MPGRRFYRCRFFLAAKQPANVRPPLPAALVDRGIGRLLCRDPESKPCIGACCRLSVAGSSMRRFRTTVHCRHPLSPIDNAFFLKYFMVARPTDALS